MNYKIGDYVTFMILISYTTLNIVGIDNNSEHVCFYEWYYNFHWFFY